MDIFHIGKDFELIRNFDIIWKIDAIVANIVPIKQTIWFCIVISIFTRIGANPKRTEGHPSEFKINNMTVRLRD